MHAEYFQNQPALKTPLDSQCMNPFIQYCETYIKLSLPITNIRDSFWPQGQVIPIQEWQCGVRLFNDKDDEIQRCKNQRTFRSFTCSYHFFMERCMIQFYHLRPSRSPNADGWYAFDHKVIDSIVKDVSLNARLKAMAHCFIYYAEFFLKVEYIQLTRQSTDRSHFYSCYVSCRNAKINCQHRPGYENEFKFLDIREHMRNLKPYCVDPNGGSNWFEEELESIIRSDAYFPNPELQP